ncbi:MFS transporter [Rhodococcus sp. T2V]|uniref:MFS transporter n=1 Tax=Rhodococcus sp. T2V TaxID=3034164 RepID=UPI0023E341F5|nr:MFS transporter [Rhodococcus sp. T2V]
MSVCSFVFGVPFVVPFLREASNLSLTSVSAYVAAPTVGLLLTLILWGAAADRFGERAAMTAGLLTTALAIGTAAALSSHNQAITLILLAVGGAAAASVFAANGRLTMAWFPPSERGLAMGIRQTAQPLGVALAGLILPRLSERTGPFGAFMAPAALCVVSALLVAVIATSSAGAASARQQRGTTSPYETPTLWRIHLASALLIVPQFAISAFSMEYLVREHHWGTAAAGGFVAVIQIAGAISRIGAGLWSDLVGSRLRPMKHLSVAAGAVLLAFAVGDAIVPWLAIGALAVGGIVTVADNGLAYTAVAEISGPAWSGKALGIHNTGQNLVSSLTPLALGVVIGMAGYGIGFLTAAIAPLAAILVNPVDDEKRSDC